MTLRNRVFIFVFIMLGIEACVADEKSPTANDDSQIPISSSLQNISSSPNLSSSTNPSLSSIKEEGDSMSISILYIQVNENTLQVELANNSSTKALISELSSGPITVEMRDYGSMEKVGSLGKQYPTNNQQIQTEAGDVILYQGSLLVIYYAPNSWSFTRLGKIQNINADELKALLGDGDVVVTLQINSIGE